jgi:glucose-like phosphotransferase system IIB component
MQLRAEKVLKLIGGKSNVKEFGNCATRLRLVVVDPTKVDTDLLKRQGGAVGVMKKGNAVQVIIGPEVDVLAQKMEKML